MIDDIVLAHEFQCGLVVKIRTLARDLQLRHVQYMHRFFATRDLAMRFLKMLLGFYNHRVSTPFQITG